MDSSCFPSTVFGWEGGREVVTGLLVCRSLDWDGAVPILAEETVRRPEIAGCEQNPVAGWDFGRCLLRSWGKDALPPLILSSAQSPYVETLFLKFLVGS